jgi:ATP-binding cassette subfamily C (CFTR/MRP) protein 1
MASYRQFSNYGIDPVIQEIPLATASWLSVLTFSWITPILDLGYARTLQATDLYAVDESRSAGPLGAGLDAAWDRRMRKAKEYNERLARGEVTPSFGRKTVWWVRRRLESSVSQEEQERKWREGKRKRPSLAWALNDVIGRRFWIAGVYKVC